MKDLNKLRLQFTFLGDNMFNKLNEIESHFFLSILGTFMS